jgi:hypothetical protein
VNEKIVLQKPPPRVEPPKLSDYATQAEVAQVEQLEQTSGESLLKRGSLSHPLIVQARSVLKSGQADDRKLLWSRESCLDIRVSKDSLDRALRIMVEWKCKAARTSTEELAPVIR